MPQEVNSDRVAAEGCRECGKPVESSQAGPACAACGLPRHMECWETMESAVCEPCEDRALRVLSDANGAVIAQQDHPDWPLILEPDLFTVWAVSSYQGVVDNGGFEYFFWRDWPRQVPYHRFVEALTEIGAVDSAELLKKAVGLFPFANPSQHCEQRRDPCRTVCRRRSGQRDRSTWGESDRPGANDVPAPCQFYSAKGPSQTRSLKPGAHLEGGPVARRAGMRFGFEDGRSSVPGLWGKRLLPLGSRTQTARLIRAGVMRNPDPASPDLP